MVTKGEALRERIVEAADQLFYQKGYENTSFSDIADAVGISRGNFYYHFKTKDEILNAVIDTRVSNIQWMLDDWDNKISDPKKRIHYYIDMQSRNQDNVVEHGCPVGSLCTELSKINHTMLNDANKMFNVFRDWLVIQLKEAGVTRNTKQIAMHLLARGQGIATIASAFTDREFMKQEVKRLKQWLDEEIANAGH